LEAELAAFTPATCKKAFNNTGFINENNKFDHELVLKRIAQNLGPFTRNSPGTSAEAREATASLIESANSRTSEKVHHYIVF
jgi:hypothetical protein